MARILIHSADPWVRHLAQNYMDREPEAWLKDRLGRIKVVPSQDEVFTDSRECLRLAHSQPPREWKKTQRRLAAEFRQRPAEQRG